MNKETREVVKKMGMHLVEVSEECLERNELGNSATAHGAAGLILILSHIQKTLEEIRDALRGEKEES